MTAAPDSCVLYMLGKFVILCNADEIKRSGYKKGMELV